MTRADSGSLKYLNFPLPQLDFLSITGSPFEDTVRFSPSAGQFPVLRKLSLSLVMVPWGSSIFTTLVSLELFGVRMLQNASAHSLFLDMLEHCNDLQRLELDGVLPTEHGGLQDLTRVVRVPNLQKLLIHDVPPYIPWLLEHLSLRSSTLVNIHFRGSNDHPFEFPYVSRLFPHQVRENLAAFSQARFLAVLAEHKDELLIISDLNRDVCDEFEASLAFSMEVDEDVDLSLYMPALLQDIASLFTSDLLHLKIGGITSGMVVDHWKSVLNHFPSLEMLDITVNDEPRDLFRALLNCCFHLRRAIMRRVFMLTEDVQALLAYLSSRAGLGNKLEHLRIETCLQPLDEDARRIIASYVNFPVEFEVYDGDDTS
ncbi:uncharacterized protein LAESUDRAFT_727222 [Laetiporus sulphureus 93-53]|uniref:F-box domain-containing protein n=1 Tax=Laetiporus sulphureus 93-53 TaxID=1314785 RepID=A0A165DNH2_9APHY|nr:uncharacterized protein LAESUDRAFT_727222 [Laetiporus sulphureus 93-53]KZT05269.1 hypothetical protein LAESUDRAFT_727222 [Laetiporus sulphureus 93-53]